MVLALIRHTMPHQKARGGHGIGVSIRSCVFPAGDLYAGKMVQGRELMQAV